MIVTETARSYEAPPREVLGFANELLAGAWARFRTDAFSPLNVFVTSRESGSGVGVYQDGRPYLQIHPELLGTPPRLTEEARGAVAHSVAHVLQSDINSDAVQ